MAVDDDGILGLVRGDDGPQGVSAQTGSHTHTTVSRSCVDTPTHRRTLGTAAFASSTTQHNTTQRDAALVIAITAAAAAAVSLLLELMHEQWFAARKTCLLLVAVCPHTYRTDPYVAIMANASTDGWRQRHSLTQHDTKALTTHLLILYHNDLTLSVLRTSNQGGGIYSNDGTLTLTNCEISGNSAVTNIVIFSDLIIYQFCHSN